MPLPINSMPSSALPQAINLSNSYSDFEFRTPSIEEVSSQNFPELPSIEVIVKLRSPTLKFVPKRICSEWSRAWTETVQDCIYGNNIPSYTFLFLLSKTCLRVPPSNISSRRAKEDFSLQLFKRWRGSVLTNGNTSKHEDEVQDSGIPFHYASTGESFKFEETKILEREKNSLKRKILESIHISNKIDSLVNLKLGMKLNPAWSPLIKDLKLSWGFQASGLLYLHFANFLLALVILSLSCVFKILGW